MGKDKGSHFPLGRMMGRTDWERTEEERKVCKALEEVAKQVGVTSIQAGKCYLGVWGS